MVAITENYNSKSRNIIECRDVSIILQSKTVLDRSSCTIPRNALTFIVGENGSGKTTLIKGILGLIPIVHGGISINSLSESKPVIGYVPQKLEFPKYFQMTVQEYFKYSAEVPTHLIETVARTADFPETHFKAPITELSGGQIQKLLLAAELYRKPEILFLDEPLANVDNEGEKHILDVILEIKTEGVTIVIITHDWQMVSSYADHVICLNKNFICNTGLNCICKNSLSKVNVKNIQKVTPDPGVSHEGYCYIENI
jgi:ABC-type Mn2+/Zn2+ transport system ATPase subunit